MGLHVWTLGREAGIVSWDFGALFGHLLAIHFLLFT